MEIPENIINKLFVASWGYDQTQNDFIKVIGLTKSKKSAIVKRVYAKTIDVPHMTYSNIGATDNIFGPEFRLKIDYMSDGRITLRGSYPFAVYGNDQYKPFRELSKRFGYFYPTTETEKHMQTNPQFGH